MALMFAVAPAMVTPPVMPQVIGAMRAIGAGSQYSHGPYGAQVLLWHYGADAPGCANDGNLLISDALHIWGIFL